MSNNQGILCPNCFKGRLHAVSEDSKQLKCEVCKENFIQTAPNTVRYM